MVFTLHLSVLYGLKTNRDFCLTQPLVKPKLRVFTERYALSHYITGKHLVFQELKIYTA